MLTLFTCLLGIFTKLSYAELSGQCTEKLFDSDHLFLEFFKKNYICNQPLSPLFILQIQSSNNNLMIFPHSL